MKVKKYALLLNYIGTHFSGFQKQPSKDSVQDHLEKALAIFLGEKTISTRGTSRTDSGVHAAEQWVVFQTTRTFCPKQAFISLNALLHHDIGILEIKEVAEEYEPIHKAQAKLYHYRLWQGMCPRPLLTPYVWQLRHKVDRQIFKEQGSHYIGTHNFKSFCNTDSEASTFDREIYGIHIEEQGDLIHFYVLGRGFLKQMVRIMVGTLVDISRGHINKSVPEILLAKKRTLAGITAPPQGLCLEKIYLDTPPSIEQAIQDGKQSWFL